MITPITIIKIGVLISCIGFIMMHIEKHYVQKILPNKSVEEQKRYWEIEKEKSEMGAYNIPFHKGKLISKGNTQVDLYKFSVKLGIVMIVIGLINPIW